MFDKGVAIICGSVIIASGTLPKIITKLVKIKIGIVEIY